MIQSSDPDDFIIQEDVMSDIVIPKKQRKSATKATAILVTVFLVIGMTFFITSQFEYFYKPGCESLLGVARYYSYYCILVILMRLCVFLPIYNSSHDKYQGRSYAYLLICYQTLEVCLSILFLFLMTYAFMRDEPCGYLRTVTKAYLFAIYASLTLLCCIIVIAVGILGGAAVN